MPCIIVMILAHCRLLQHFSQRQGTEAHESCRLMAGLIVKLLDRPDRSVLDDIPSFFHTVSPAAAAVAGSAAKDPSDTAGCVNMVQ